MEERYPKFQIPPDFDRAEIHARCCKVFKPCLQPRNRCGCCNQNEGEQQIPLCTPVSSLRHIGEEVPMYFKFTSVMVLLVIFIIFAQSGLYMFACYSSQECKEIKYSNQMFGFNITIWMGFQKLGTFFLMIEVIVYSVVILMIKVYLKKRKYDFKSFSFEIEKRSVQLTNLSKQATREQIQALFKDFSIEEIVFAYRVNDYFKLMSKISRQMRKLKRLNDRLKKLPSLTDEVDKLSKTTEINMQRLKDFHSKLMRKENRLSIAFVVFQTVSEQKRAIKTHKHFLAAKLWLKLCTCCSSSAIRGQHVTVEAAPSPDDINWMNLENPYLTTKFIRFCSSFACMVVLLFGIVSEVMVINNSKVSDFIGNIFSLIIIFGINFLIVNFLQWTTHKFERRETNTMIKKSLVRKLTVFMFINVSISPYLIFIYNIWIKETEGSVSLVNISFTVLMVSLGNLFKPLLTVVSVPRFANWLKRLKEKSKGSESNLNQLEANKLFQPIEFPIQLYYSLVLTSLMMCFFYLGSFQILFVVELPSLLILIWVAKYALLRVCKTPQGLSMQLNNLAQSLLRFFVPLYWLGSNMTNFITYKWKETDFISWLFRDRVYSIVSISVVCFMLVCEFSVKIAALWLSNKFPGDLSEYLMEGQSGRTYSEANIYFQLSEEIFDGRKTYADEFRRNMKQYN